MGKNFSNESCRKWATVIGACLVMSATGMSRYWGNMYVYVISYQLTHQQSTVTPDDNSETPWTLSMWLVGICVGYILSGILTKFELLSNKVILLFGIVSQNTGILLVYFVIDRSALLFNVFMAGFHGLGVGIVRALVIQITVCWFEGQTGVSVGMIRASSILGAFFVNQFMTSYLNPGNQAPGKKDGEMVLFSDDEITDGVPRFFLILSVCFFTLQLVSYTLIREKPAATHLQGVNEPNEEGAVVESKLRKDPPQECSRNVKRKFLIFKKTHRTDLECQHSDTSDPSHSQSGSKEEHPHVQQYSVLQMLHTCRFYTYFFTLGLSSPSYLVFSNYYKLYGQLWIRDDHFLTFLGDVIIALSVTTCFVWGTVLDRYGNKTCLLYYFSSLPVATLFFYFSPMVGNKWLFSFTAVLVAGLTAPLYSIYTTCLIKAFGNTEFSAKFSLLLLSTLVMDLTCPKLLETILENLGWFYTFFMGSVLNVVALVWVMFTLPAFE